jgi:CRP-like cAMP-binding protein
LAGKNIILKQGQVLFNYGDDSDGMFLVRRGDVKIFIHDAQANEIVLAKVTSGAMIGEMALFDNLPRSASASAITDVEVTHITKDEFNRIMKQIPKWFVNLMSTLSSRLRSTNDRLNETESLLKSRANPLEELQLILNTFNLLWYKLSTKTGKIWVVEPDPIKREVCEILGVNRSSVQRIVEEITENGIIRKTKDSYNADLLAAKSRNALERLCKFVTKFRRDNLAFKTVPPEVLDVINIAEELLDGYAYDPATISYSDIEERAFDKDIRTDTWAKYLSVFRNLDESIQLVKMGTNLGFKVQKKGFKELHGNINLMNKLSN